MNNIKCLWCIYKIKTKFFIPIKYINNKYEVIGQFCCINCCLAYILNSNLVYSKSLLIQLLYKMYESFLIKNKIKKIIPSPPKEILLDFGGKFSYEEYNKLKIKYVNLILPPITSINIEFEKLDFNDSIKKKNIPITDNQINNAKNNLLLKRKKPLKSKYISIEKTMGLVKIN